MNFNLLLALPEAIELEAVVYEQEPVIKLPWYIKQIDNKLLLFNAANADCVINIFDVESGEITQQWGTYGNGPGEFTVSMYWGCDDEKQTFYLYDPNQAIMRAYKWKHTDNDIEISLLQEVGFKKRADINLIRGCRFVKDKFIANANYGVERPILLLDS